MNFKRIADPDVVFTDGKVVMFLTVDMEGRYDFMPGYRKDNQYFYPDGYPLAPDFKTVEWSELPKLPDGCLYVWE
mgnify:CR=1 FL=1